MATDLQIARAATLRPIAEIALKAGIPLASLEPYGRFKAKIGFDFIHSAAARPPGKLVLVTAISPTPAGEGKTTTTIGLGDALNAIGTRTMICLREPSLGPSFGQKGGATGGGYSQVVPMEEINLHFTGDFHAITAASEVMAVFCLAADLADLQDRLGRIIVAARRDGSAITARDLKADGAMAALLRDALMPNLVQTIDGSPALVHGGPFANIAHGCNSVMATTLGLRLADVVVTEAGFGADLGAEKFLDIKCRSAALSPDCAVVVATIRALKMHGGVGKADLGASNPEAVARGVVNLSRHVENMGKFGLPVVVALNRFTSDTDAEFAVVRKAMARQGVEMFLCTHWADGAAGAADLARAVRSRLDAGRADFAPLYPDALPLVEKVRTIAREIYRAADISLPPSVSRKLAGYEAAGFGHVPVCIAKTQYSFSADPGLIGAPTGHILPVRDVRLSAGAGFVVAICGDILSMPGLPRKPASETIFLDAQGRIEGLF